MAFVRVPGNPEPEGVEELWLEGRGGVRVRAAFAPATGGPPRGTAIVCNGRTEYIEKHFETMRELQSRGFCVIQLDWRGQGLSGRLTVNPLKGHLDTLDDPVQDLADALAVSADRLPRPHVLIAHSMGGGIALRGMQTRRIAVDAALFSAPMWGIAGLSDFSKKLAAAAVSFGLGKSFAPGVETKWRKESFRKNAVTHDATRHARNQALITAEPGLALAGVTLGWVHAASEAIEGFRAPGALAHLRLPIVVLSAGEEEIVENASHDALVKLLPQAEHRLIDGAKHEILGEIDPIRAQAWAAFDALADRVAPRRAA